MNQLKFDLKGILLSNTDDKYRLFAQKLLPRNTKMLGVRLPVLRRIAHKVVRGDWQYYLNQLSNDTFEERLLYGMITAYAPIKIPEKIPFIRCYLSKMNNWSLCDSFCASFQLTEQEKTVLLPFIEECLRSADEYVVRFGIVMLLNFYISTDLKRSFDLFQSVTHTGYYVDMAIAWAVSICYIRFPKETQAFLQYNTLNNCAHNKAIQKIRESRCLDKSEKDLALRYKRG